MSSNSAFPAPETCRGQHRHRPEPANWRAGPPGRDDRRRPTGRGMHRLVGPQGSTACRRPGRARLDVGRGSPVGRTDVYGLGAILYEILAGQPPFSGESTQEVLREVREQPPAPPSKVARSTPAPTSPGAGITWRGSRSSRWGARPSNPRDAVGSASLLDLSVATGQSQKWALKNLTFTLTTLVVPRRFGILVFMGPA